MLREFLSRPCDWWGCAWRKGIDICEWRMFVPHPLSQSLSNWIQSCVLFSKHDYSSSQCRVGWSCFPRLCLFLFLWLKLKAMRMKRPSPCLVLRFRPIQQSTNSKRFFTLISTVFKKQLLCTMNNPTWYSPPRF